MYNPRNYAISIEKILGTPQSLIGEIENNPLSFLSSFLDKRYYLDDATAKLIDSFDEEFSKYKGLPLINWEEKDAEKLVNYLRRIFS